MASLCMCGCQPQALDNASDQPPLVVVSNALQREVTDFVDFTGRTEAPQSVDVRTRVTGYLLKTPFELFRQIRAEDHGENQDETNGSLKELHIHAD